MQTLVPINQPSAAPEFLAFIANPVWTSQLRQCIFHFPTSAVSLSRLFSGAVELSHYEFILRFFLLIEDKTYQRQLILANNAVNLLQAIANNHVDILNIFFDALNLDEDPEVQSLLENHAKTWIPLITQPETLTPLLNAMTFPTLLKVTYILHQLTIDPSKPWLYAVFSLHLFMNINNLLFSLTHNAPPRQEIIVKALIENKLEHYIASIDNHHRRQFYFFKSRQTENRQINYELARQLQMDLKTKSITATFADIYRLRNKIRQNHQNPPWFNWIRSAELNSIIHLAQSCQT